MLVDDLPLIQQPLIDPVESLIAVAQARNADAIVVGHGGQGPMRGALLGSITYEIVHRSPVPVVVVPDPEDA